MPWPRWWTTPAVARGSGRRWKASATSSGWPGAPPPANPVFGGATPSPGLTPAPLNLSSMFWTWLDGYKFVKIDGKTTGQPNGALMHLGSTGCVESSPNVVTSCATPNRRVVTLMGFDPTSSVVVADLATLFAGSNLDANAGGPPGCMSGPTDSDCAPIFAALGLAFGGGAQPATQSFFRVE